MVKSDFERARVFPQFMWVFAEAFADRVKRMPLEGAYDSAMGEAVDCFCDADPAMLTMSDEEFEEANRRAMGGT
jgi:hypothetical protein